MWDGVARIFDFTGVLNTPGKALPPNVADRRALRKDWETVGDDLMAVIGSQDSDGVSANRKALI